MKRMLLTIFVILFLFLISCGVYLFVGSAPQAEGIAWGVNFSQKHATNLGLDWQETYTALLDELGVRRLKVSVDWNNVHPEQNRFYFNDVDWQVAEAEKKGAALLLVAGMKTPRWPECHIPEWAMVLGKEAQQKQILSLLEQLVLRYKDSPALWAWQIENEPLFPFGKCPWIDKEFLKQEVRLVKSLDASHPVVISDSGELSLWIEAAKTGDMVSTTMYRKVWFHEVKRYIEYPLPPIFYARKAQFIDTLFGKEVIVGELQAEPWGPGKLLYYTTLEEQEAAFDLAQFRKNIDYAKHTGLREFYLWGAEWWYWLKQTQDDATFWNEAKKLFQ